MNKSYKAPKFPRVWVSLKRHAALSHEAAKLGITVGKLAERKFRAAAAGTGTGNGK